MRVRDGERESVNIRIHNEHCNMRYTTKSSGRAMGWGEERGPHPFLTTAATSATHRLMIPFQYNPPFVEHSGSVESSLASYLTCRNCPTEVKTHQHNEAVHPQAKNAGLLRSHRTREKQRLQ